MQTWICQFCHRPFKESEELISHIFNVHQEDMTDPANRGIMLLNALQVLNTREDKRKLVIGLS